MLELIVLVYLKLFNREILLVIGLFMFAPIPNVVLTKVLDFTFVI